MRGRTNITQRAVPYVNGNVITAIADEQINIGDFVEYKTESSSQTISNEYKNVLMEKDTEHYKFVLTSGPQFIKLTCFDKSTFNIRCSKKFDLTAAESGIYGCFEIIDESNILLSFIGTPNMLIYLTIEDDNFVINQSIQNGYYAICKVDSTHFIVNGVHNGANLKILLYSFDYTNKTFTYISEYNYNSESIQTYNAGLRYLRDMGNGAIFVFTSYSLTSSGTRYLYCYLLNYDSINQTFSVEEKSSALGTYGTGTYCKFLDLDYDTVSMIFDSDSITVVEYDSVNNTFETNSFSAILTSTQKGFSLLENNKILLFGYLTSPNRAYVVLTYDKVNNIFVPSNYLENMGSTITLLFCMYNNGDIKSFCARSVNAEYFSLLLFYINSVLQMGVDKTRVKQYAGNNAIGFAKTGADAGNNVSIYVPNV